MFDAYKELTPVVYGENAIRYLAPAWQPPGSNSFPLHWHDRMEILYLTEGNLHLHLGNREFCLLPGQAAVVSPAMMHGGMAGETGVAYHTIMFDLEKFCNGTAASHKYLTPACRRQVSYPAVAKQKEVTEAICRLAAALGGGDRHPLTVIGMVYEILGELDRCGSDRPVRLPRVDSGFEKILKYLDEHFEEPVCAKSVSERFGYNESYFCRRFKAVTGFSMMRYLQLLRMDQAQKLMTETGMEIGKIAIACGFSDMGYFSACFKKHVGCTPTEFRKRRQI